MSAAKIIPKNGGRVFVRRKILPLQEKNMRKGLQAPVPKKIPEKLIKFDDLRVDYYYWMRERERPEVRKHLEAENEYFARVTRDVESFRNTLFEELKARLKDEDESVPYRYKDYYYQVRYPKGKEFPVFLRWKTENQKETFFDANIRGAKKDFYQLGALKITPDDTTLAFTEDMQGRRLYEIRFKDLKTGKVYDEVIKNTTGTGVWAQDSRTFFYVVKHPETLRAYRLYKHTLGTAPENDVLIYEETDPEYDIHISKSKSEQFIFLVISANTTTEYRYIFSDRPDMTFRLLKKRIKGVEYYPYHLREDEFLMVTNENAPNYKILKGRLNAKEKEWEVFLPHREETLIEELEIFRDFIALTERNNGLTRLRILSLDKKEDFYIDFPEETYTVYLDINAEINSRKVRYVYNSLTTPASVLEYDVDAKKKEILKEDVVAGGKFDKENYRSLRLWAPGRDGTRIPVSLVWHKKLRLYDNNPLLLYAYGAYGITVDDNFSHNRLSLLDRGFVFAIAHVRGGEYLGRKWYEEGKLLKKKNTFYDFIDAARYLIAENITSPEKLYAMGGSAGGLLMGAVANMAPQLFKGIVAQVPFVDVLTTMLDENIPLTTGEYDEWGNPNEKKYYDYIKSYSPYDNIVAQAYPNILATAGFHDSQVQYWEPAKWVAKLREYNRGDSLILLHTEMNAGHSGVSGRFKSLKDTARDFAFILDLAGKMYEI